MFDFPLTVDTLENVPAEHQALYVEGDDGSFKMIETLAKKVGDLGNLTSTLQKTRKQLADQDRALKGFTAIAKTPDELRAQIEGYRAFAETPEALAELIEEKNKLLEGKGDATKLVEQVKNASAAELKKLQEKWQAELAGKDTETKGLRSALETEMVDSTLTAEIAKQKGAPELLLPVARRYVRVVAEDGKFIRQVVDEDGDPRVNAKGDPMTISELITEMRASDVFARAFDGENRSGSGVPPGGGGNPRGAKVYTKDQWTTLVASERDPEKRKALLRDKSAGKIQVRN